MLRNTEFRFGSIPLVNIKRSVFKMRKNVKGTFNLGYIIPFYVNADILPGDTFKVKQSIVVRMLTPIYPTMDNLVLDTYFFATQYRRLWDNFKKFMGENESGSWVQATELEIPQLRVKSTATGTAIPGKGSLWDYMGLPINVKGYDSLHPLEISDLPFRAYTDIYNFFFRNESLIAPINFSKGDATQDFYINAPAQGGAPLKASRLPDYLSTCLPSPQKSPTGAINIPLGTTAPIFSNSSATMNTDLITKPYFYKADGSKIVPGNNDHHNLLINNTGNLARKTTTQEETSSDTYMSLYADLSQATAATINALRLAFQTQKLYEADARFGTRYFDEVLQHFGVSSGAAKYEKPQYLGGKRIPLQINQVSQTSAPSAGQPPMGNVGGFSLTADVDQIFTQSFTEHSIIIGVMVARYLSHTYQQNIPRQWSRKKRLDFYWPELAHLGEQPVYNKEIYVASNNGYADEVFGYQERWAEYKYENNVICGELRSTYSTPLDTWHYGDKYDSLPVLSQSWIEETDTYLTRTLAVHDHDQFIFDTDLDITAIRPIPTYCTPGLIDHF